MLSPRENASSIFRPTWRMVLLLGVAALAISAARVVPVRKDRAFVGQGYMYKEIALALASGRGYIETHGYWTGQPTVTRPPLWPYVLSVPLRACQGCNSIAVTQYATAVMHAATTLAVALLVWVLTGSRKRMMAAFLATALLPEAQPLIMGGFCEPLAAVVLVTGILLICLGGRYFYGGVAVLAFLPLVRPNFVLFWFAVAALVWWLQFRKGSRVRICAPSRLLAAAVLFCIPSAAWILRNYLVSGAFPMLAGTSGMTLYGNYNSYSGTFGPGFGRWVHPDAIPGQEKIGSLQGKMTEPQVIRYYDRKGKEYIAQHWKMVPLLVAAHATLWALPSPADGVYKYIFWLGHMALYAAAIVAVRRRSIRLGSWFGVLLACTVAMTAVTVVLYSAEARYLYPLNILLLVFVCSARYRAAVERALGKAA